MGFVDSKKTGNYLGYPIISLEDLDRDTTAIVITISNVFAVSDVYKDVCKAGFKNIYLYNNAKERNYYLGESFLVEECIEIREWNKPILATAEMHIVDWCNLNCKACSHFAPLCEKEFPNTQRRIEDVKRTAQLFPNILRFRILGGEPLLSPDIITYISEIRRILPNSLLHLATNGLLIPSIPQEVLECMKKNDVIVYITNYQPTSKMLDRIVERLVDNGIFYEIDPADKPVTTFYKSLDLSEKSNYQRKCWTPGCIEICDGKIARCPSLIFIKHFNNKFGTSLPDEGILDLYEYNDGNELLEEMRKNIPLCNYCVSEEVEWQQCKKEIRIDDFAKR